MTNHYARAQELLARAETEKVTNSPALYASFATAHGILALIDLIQSEITVGDEHAASISHQEYANLGDTLAKAQGRIYDLEQNTGKLHRERNQAWERIRELEQANEHLTLMNQQLSEQLETWLDENPISRSNQGTTATAVDTENADTILQPKVT